MGKMAQADIRVADGLTQTLASVRTESGACLLSLAEASPVLLIFLRHFGCSFCRMTISQIGELQNELRDRGVRPVFVHLGTPDVARAHFDFYGLSDVERIHDPEGTVYRDPAFALGRVNPWWHLVNPVVWFGWLNGTVFKHGIGRIETDGHQMPGVFVLKGPKIASKFLYRNISDQPKWLKLIS
jgi:thiol-disulfide isomerase/thioredoxin